ncbi:MAG: hypothetical protein WAL40_11420, partial [Rhodoplanes sp.]
MLINPLPTSGSCDLDLEVTACSMATVSLDEKRADSFCVWVTAETHRYRSSSYDTNRHGRGLV